MTETEIANGARAEVTLELGGESYLLKPEFAVVARIEDALEISLFQLATQEVQNGPDLPRAERRFRPHFEIFRHELHLGQRATEAEHAHERIIRN